MHLLTMALLIGVILLIPSTVIALLTRESDRGTVRPWPVRLLGVGLVGVAGIALGMMLELPTATAVTIGILYGLSIAAWLPATHDWATRGTVTWALTVDVSLIYLAAMALWTFWETSVWWGTLSSLVLWLVEIFAAVLGLAYVWEFVDVLTRRRWPASVDPEELPGTLTKDLPFVSLHVPTYNEPPDMVIETLEHLVRIDYPAFEILLIDNNTTDPALWRPVEGWCAGHPNVKFVHIENLPGFKSGALNYALKHTYEGAEVIGIVDADYNVDPDFLKDCAPLFGNPDVSFVQTPQDYRDWDKAPYFRRLYLSYGYFFDVSQRSRNERNGAIFAGTMGLIRRAALENAGGWDEWCITEDAELSLRLLRDGGRGLHVDRTYGHGMMPLTFEALKRQRFRWCFGGIQILRMHWKSLIPGPVTPQNQMSNAQRWAYLGGGLQWYGDAATLLLTLFLLAGAADAIFYRSLDIRYLSVPMLSAVLALVVVGSVRALALLRRTSGATWRESIGAFGIWLGTSWAVTSASIKGLFSREGKFLRTPKVRGEVGVGHALRANLPETVLAASCVVMAIASAAQGQVRPVVIGALLLVQAAGYSAALANSISAIRADLPETLRRRRTTREVLATGAKQGGVALGVLTVAGLVLAMLAAPAATPTAQLPAWTKPLHPNVKRWLPDPHRTPLPLPTPAPSSPSGPAPSGGPTRAPSTAQTPEPTTTPSASVPAEPTQTPSPKPTTTPSRTPSPSPQPTSSASD
jgi:cellulose synthase/poly-beta-1,6-N-acetylglucosamine synthase-like glycosyltransferase